MRNFTVSKALRSTKSLERYILDPFSLRMPLTLKNGERSIVEIGFGNGELLSRMAHSRAKDFFIGIDSSEISCEKAAKRAYDFKLKNLKIVRGDAKFLIHELFMDESVDLILAFYPIPWPKKSQSDKRLFDANFLMSVSSILKSSGRFVIVTDDHDYFEWTRENLKSLGIAFNTRELQPLKSTKYGRKWENLGRKSWSIVVHSKQFKVERILEGFEMPHVHLNDINLGKLEKLSRKKFSEQKTIVQFKGLFKGKEGYILRAVSVDGKFPQMYYILVKPQEKGWLVRLDDVAKVFKTPAVKMSVEYVAKEVKSENKQ